MDVDTIILFAQALIGLALTCLGLIVSTRPESLARRRLVYELLFVVLGVVLAVLVVVQGSRAASERQRADAQSATERKESRTALAAVKSSADEMARSDREARLQQEVEVGLIQRKIELISHSVSLLLNKNSSNQKQITTNIKQVEAAATPTASSKVITSFNEIDNSILRTRVVEVVIKIRDLMKTYEDSSQSISRAHLRLLEKAWRRENPRTNDTEAMLAALTKDIDRLGDPDSFRRYLAETKDRPSADRHTLSSQSSGLPSDAERVAALKAFTDSDADLDELPPIVRSTDINAMYIERARQNLQALIWAFQTRHQKDARLYKEALLLRLPAGDANVQINYDMAPLAPSQVAAIADDLERMAKLLAPTK